MKTLIVALLLSAGCDSTDNMQMMSPDLSVARLLPDLSAAGSKCADVIRCGQACTGDLTTCLTGCTSDLTAAATPYWDALASCVTTQCVNVDGGPLCVSLMDQGCAACVQGNCQSQALACSNH